MDENTDKKQDQQRRTDEISKKDLLREKDISYGQFYRWKRMGLIPEAWFRRRSTFTGQETFLPRRQVIERIDRIQELKDRLSLDEIAEMLSPEGTDRRYVLSDAEAIDIVDPQAREILEWSEEPDGLRYIDMLMLAMMKGLTREHIPGDHVRLACETLVDRFRNLNPDHVDRRLTIVTRDGIPVCALHEGKCLFDSRATVVASVDLNALVEDLNIRLQKLEQQGE